MNSLEKFKVFVSKQTPLKAEHRILVALSGGLDSQVLLHMLVNIGFTNLTAAHVNYKTRDLDSDLDQACAAAWAKKLKVPLLDKEIVLDYSKGNFQEKARAHRYAWFDQIIMKRGIEYLLTAHHKNDNHETMAMRFFSGSRGHGLTGISTVSKNRVRPLLCLTKSEILEYARQHDVPYRVDKSNNQSHYLRNFFRNEIFPLINGKIQGLTQRLDTTQNHLTREQHLLSNFCYDFISKNAFWRGSIAIISIDNLKEEYLRKALICFVLKLNENQAEQILTAKKQHVLEFNRWKASYSQGKLWVQQKDNNKEFLLNIDPTLPIDIELPNGHLSGERIPSLQLETDPFIEVIPIREDHDCFLIQKWKKGDQIEIQAGHKKVSDLLNEKKLSPLEKEKVCCLWARDTLLWVIGVRLSKEAYANKEDLSFIKLKYQAASLQKRPLPDVKSFFEVE